MKSSLKQIWDNKAKILEGITNTLQRDAYIEQIAEERMNMCNSCIQKSTNCGALIESCCSICGCSLKFKTHSMASSCPIDKWLPLLNTNNDNK